ncbi:cholesterol 25-hydroxylase-like protein 1, member 2 [Lethenteron reissneri]|uniref:cholesterol 25-hydroxylase-like protein 1, member 2 n=1 Tax=Lethenteron reissneri TaxID=7753 RepID=UPI002AB6B1EA|nr:cholesterol 25-hydroxylase-like protein 1, member 2 [Lethenteron reissneri]
MEFLKLNDSDWLSRYYARKSVLQPAWDHLRLNYTDQLRSPAFPVVFNVAFYVFCCLCYMPCNLLGKRWAFVHRYKIQQNTQPTSTNFAKCFWLTMYNHCILIFPAGVAQWYWRPPIPLPEEAPNLGDLIMGVVGCLLLFDFQYFVWHMVHHKFRWLYKTFHAVHHEFMSPFSWSTQYLGCWELFVVGAWTTIDPVLLQCHLLTTWAFMAFHVYTSVEQHCGYDFPWSTRHWLPLGLFGGSLHHDMHHQKPMSNFAPHFSHMDKIFGTFSECVRIPEGEKPIQETHATVHSYDKSEFNLMHVFGKTNEEKKLA